MAAAPIISARPAPQPAPVALALSGISHRYGSRRVLDGISLDVHEGEHLALVGPSGCGKSTLLRLIAGLDPLECGRICLDGRSLSAPGLAVPPERRGIGMLFQDIALFPHLTVADNVAFGLAGLDRARRRARVAELLALVGLEDRAAAWPHMLSGGQQQRVALARALAPQPRLLLLDEPFTALDPLLRRELRLEMSDLLRRAGTTCVLVTHDPEEAMLLGDRVAVLRAGRLVQCGPPEALYHAPVDPFVAGLFGEVNRLPGHSTDGEITTALGHFAAPPGLGDGPVEVVLRPEQLRPAWGREALVRFPAVVQSARRLGAEARLRIEVATQQGVLSLSLRLADRRMPCPGELIEFGFAPADAIVFPAGSASA